MEFRSCARGRQWCGIFHYHWWTASIKPKLPFSHSGLVSWGLPFLQFCVVLQLLQIANDQYCCSCCIIVYVNVRAICLDNLDSTFEVFCKCFNDYMISICTIFLHLLKIGVEICCEEISYLFSLWNVFTGLVQFKYSLLN